jgi:D-alanyl-D-alanine carboxypeptidase/D-alanyl-D-alanine-endopeptidase (penicillin-binding protein 4)
MHYVKNNGNYKRKSRASRGRKRFAGALLLVVVAIAFVVMLRPGSHAATVEALHPEPIVPVHPPYSPAARLLRPAPRWGAAARSDLDSAVRAALAPGIEGAAAWSCIVIAQDGSVIYDDHATSAVEPASVQKLIVTDTALTQLGSSFHFDTLFASARAPLNGRIDGDLYVAGSGDPSLRSQDLLAGAGVLRKAGVQSISGHVIVDPSAITGEEINPLWNPDDANEDFMAATSGISLDGDTVEFDVTGTSPGEPALIRIRPVSDDVHYYGSVTTGGEDNVVVAATETPNQFRLGGAIPAGVSERYWVPVHGIPQYAAAVVARALKTQGVEAVHGTEIGAVPVGAEILWNHRSKPISELLAHMLFVSDNHFAEQLMRTLGGTQGAASDDAGGIAVERRALQTQGIPTPGLHLVDGSGLAHANRIAAVTLARLLQRYNSDPAGNPLYPLLPRGGKDGTLKMYDFTTAAGRVRAKSGHLDGAASLAGYVNTRKHGRVVFAFMINGSPGDPDAAIVSAVDRLAER